MLVNFIWKKIIMDKKNDLFKKFKLIEIRKIILTLILHLIGKSSRINKEMKNKILIIAAHADDEVLGCVNW